MHVRIFLGLVHGYVRYLILLYVTSVIAPALAQRTWNAKGSEPVQLIGADDKRAITATMSSAASGDLLTTQLIFQGKTSRVVPKGEAAERLKFAGHHLTSTINHWSSLDTCKEFVLQVLKPWWKKIIAEKRLQETVKLIWLIDCWSVHVSKAFREWCKEMHSSWMCTVYVAANCTSQLQPADVILQRPFKAAFRNGFNSWIISETQRQLDSGESPSHVKFNLGIINLRERACRLTLNVSW